MKRIAVFIRKHNRLVSIIGALIVFVTFLIKEGLREKLKEFVDETWRAEEAYRAEENTRSILNAIAQMQINSDIPKDSGVSRWFERDDEEEEELLIGNLTLLIERLPERRRLEKRYKELAD